jgi:hypothetical protein
VSPSDLSIHPLLADNPIIHSSSLSCGSCPSSPASHSTLTNVITSCHCRRRQQPTLRLPSDASSHPHLTFDDATTSSGMRWTRWPQVATNLCLSRLTVTVTLTTAAAQQRVRGAGVHWTHGSRSHGVGMLSPASQHCWFVLNPPAFERGWDA